MTQEVTTAHAELTVDDEETVVLRLSGLCGEAFGEFLNTLLVWEVVGTGAVAVLELGLAEQDAIGGFLHLLVTAATAPDEDGFHVLPATETQ